MWTERVKLLPAASYKLNQERRCNLTWAADSLALVGQLMLDDAGEGWEEPEGNVRDWGWIASRI